MSADTVVVDGSNIATEGRSIPSLAQLDEAVRAFIEEHPDEEIIVVVDASFGYRIDESERAVFEEAEDAGEIVSPPAGAVGRGDGFLLRIADRVGATVLSNDSFQEFHGDYQWLFDEGRLIGGKPVPGVGWIFTPRTPVRGPKSRVAVRDAKRAQSRAPRGKPLSEPAVEAIAEATAVAVTPPSERSGRRGRRRGGGGGAGTRVEPEAINDPLPFITFIAEHPLGSEVEGVVDSFTSHGAFVIADGARCYAPVVGLGDPPPRSAKEVLTRGETARFVVQALDAPRRGIELALPGLARVAGTPTDETVAAEIDASWAVHEGSPSPASGAVTADVPAPSKAPPPTRRRGAAKVQGDKAPVTTAPAKRVPAAKKATAVATNSAVGKVAAKKAPARKASVEKAPAKGATAKKAPARKAPARKAPARKAPAKKAPARKATAEKAPARTATPENVPAKKAGAKKAPAKKVGAKRVAAPEAPTAGAGPRRAPAKKTASGRARATLGDGR